jgi:hypothetical protein
VGEGQAAFPVRPTGVLVLVSAGLWGAAAILVPTAKSEIFLGMLAPLTAGIATLWTVHRIPQQNPTLVTRYLLRAFLVKMVFYGVYVTVVFLFLTFNPAAFIVSFTGFFILLHGIEAYYFQNTFRTK